MIRTITYTSFQSASTSPLTIKGYLRSLGYSTQNLKILKSHPDGILLNGTPAHMNARLDLGDTLTVQIQEAASSENIVPINLPLTIVYEDEDLLVVNKPAGMPTHPSQNNYENTLANALAYYFQQQNDPFIFRCIGRLDRDTSGLTVIAKHYVSAGILGDMIADKSQNLFTREYLAIVRGTVEPKEGTITAPLGRKPGSIIERCVDFENGEPALTHYKVTKEKDGYSLVSLILGTGRTHQIRIHMKHIGHPLIGDYLYNPDFEVMQRQALHSHRLSFPHPITGKPLEFIAPLPADMARLFP
ncbi:MAG: RluA family pseudouridine synthase [Lachnospiraceae bacterium]|nr:RluA family pseudouridine synthase [Lachnospiraceae bacterium]